MGFNCGIVGLPNVGKSTIFNALTQTQAAQAANYPFCTIEPNTGMVTVPDPRLWVLKDIAKTRGETLSDIVATIDDKKRGGNLSSAIRVFVLDHYRG